MTPAEITDLINEIQWPDACNERLSAVKSWPVLLEQIRQGWLSLLPIYLFVNSDTQPTLADWNQAWRDQGRELPMTGTVFGIWSNLANTASTSYILAYDVMQPLMAYWWNGSSQFFDTVPGDYANTTTLGTSEVGLSSQTLTLAMPAYIIAEHALTRNETTTTIQWRGSADATNATRGIIAPNAVAGSPRITRFTYSPAAKVSSGTLSYFYRTIAGTGTALFTNTAVTRKIETGYYPHFLGEGYGLKTEAIYLL